MVRFHSAGRGGMGSKMLQQHGIAAIIYGGTFIDEDFRDRKVADDWFAEKYNKKLKAVDFEATTKYRFDPRFQTGGTLGVNYATLGGRLMFFNYRSIYASEEQRLQVHDQFIVNHYLKQFNEETIRPRKQATCGEPCAAVCKKMNGEFKKDYEPYQSMGPLCGVFDQRAAETLNHRADLLGFDAISVGGVLAWMMDALDRGLLAREDLGVTLLPRWPADPAAMATFDPVADSSGNVILTATANDLGQTGAGGALVVTAWAAPRWTRPWEPSANERPLALAGALLGGPLAGVGALAAQKLLRDPIEEITSQEYLVSGPWQEPDVKKLPKAKTENPSDTPVSEP
mgnify:CR=1 FL=1